VDLGEQGGHAPKMPNHATSVHHVHAQKRYVIITYNQITSDIIASTASKTILQC